MRVSRVSRAGVGSVPSVRTISLMVRGLTKHSETDTAERLSFQPFDLDRRKTRGLIDRRTWPLPRTSDGKRIWV